MEAIKREAWTVFKRVFLSHYKKAAQTKAKIKQGNIKGGTLEKGGNYGGINPKHKIICHLLSTT